MDASKLRERSVRPVVKYLPMRLRREGGEGSGVGMLLEYTICFVAVVGWGGISFDGVLGRGEEDESDPEEDDPTDSREGVLRSRRRLAD